MKKGSGVLGAKGTEKIVFFIVLIFLLSNSLAFAVEKPEPFGLKLGVTTKSTALSIISNEGGKVVSQGYKIVKGDVLNTNVEGVEVKKLPVDDLIKATFWFYKGLLYRIEYTFPLSTSKEEFTVVYNQLKAKYGAPKKFVKPWLADGIAEWNFGDVVVRLFAPWASWDMYLIYEHVPLSKEVEKSDQEVFKKETAKPKKGL